MKKIKSDKFPGKKDVVIDCGYMYYTNKKGERIERNLKNGKEELFLKKLIEETECHVECDITKDRTWKGEYYCSLHCVWFRYDDDDKEPEFCPAGEAYKQGFAAGQIV